MPTANTLSDEELIEAITRHSDPATMCRLACGDTLIVRGHYRTGDTVTCDAHGDQTITTAVTVAIARDL